MDSARPKSPNSLLSLQEAAQKLAVSVDVLLRWNEHNILKPIITSTGQVAYREEQIEQFLHIRKTAEAPSLETITDIPHIPLITHEPVIRQSISQESVSQPITATFVESEPLNSSFSNPIRMKKISQMYHPSYRALFSLAVVVVILSSSVFSQPRLNTLFNQSGKNQVADGNENGDLAFSNPDNRISPIQLQHEEASGKYLQVEGDSVMQQKLPASNEIYSPKSKESSDEEILARGKTSGGVDPEIVTADTGAFSSYSQRGNFQEAREQTIDENGNIKGSAEKIDVLTMLGGIGTNSNAFRPVTTDPKIQLILLVVGTVGFASVFWKQLSYVGFQPRRIATMPSYLGETTASEKVLEVSQKTDGTVVMYLQGKEFRISKPELYSESDRFFERLIELSQNLKEFDYDSLRDDKLRLTTPLSRVVTRLGFVGLKRDLFFPRTSKDKLLFRRFLTLSDLNAMNLTPEQILNDLLRAS